MPAIPEGISSILKDKLSEEESRKLVEDWVLQRKSLEVSLVFAPLNFTLILCVL